MNWLFAQYQRILPKHLLSRLIGCAAASKKIWLKTFLITTFSKFYEINWLEAARQQPEQYNSFNDFFSRELEPGCRPVSGQLSCPADGVVSASGHLKAGQLIQAKGINYELSALVGNHLPNRFTDGSYLTVYLAPHDYHRVHFPCQGQLLSSQYIPGDLFSVNAATTEHIDGLFTRNERLVFRLSTAQGEVIMVMVGAMIVAAMQSVWNNEPYKAASAVEESFDSYFVDQGQEAGRFLLGSTVILITDWHTNWRVHGGDKVKVGENLEPVLTC